MVGYGLSCPAKRSNAEALAYDAGYIGPGAPSAFLKTFKIPANGFLIDLRGATLFSGTYTTADLCTFASGPVTMTFSARHG